MADVAKEDSGGDSDVDMLRPLGASTPKRDAPVGPLEQCVVVASPTQMPSATKVHDALRGIPPRARTDLDSLLLATHMQRLSEKKKRERAEEHMKEQRRFHCAFVGASSAPHERSDPTGEGKPIDYFFLR
jgi:hypothetical protein